MGAFNGDHRCSNFGGSAKHDDRGLACMEGDMSLEELDLVQEYQRSCAGETEVDVDRLMWSTDRLTTNGKTREGKQVIRARQDQILDAMRKLNDLWIEIINPPVPSTVIHLDDLRELRRVG